MKPYSSYTELTEDSNIAIDADDLEMIVLYLLGFMDVLTDGTNEYAKYIDRMPLYVLESMRRLSLMETVAIRAVVNKIHEVQKRLIERAKNDEEAGIAQLHAYSFKDCANEFLAKEKYYKQQYPD